MQQTIAERIRALREARGWSKLELGRRLGGKNPRVTVHRWETGVVIPSPQNVAKVAEVFGVPVSDVDPAGSAYSLTGPRRKSHGVDNPVEVGKIPYSPQHPPTTTEGPMSDQVRRLEGALLLLPEQHRESFVRKISLIAAQMLIDLEGPGVTPGKRKRASGEG